MTKAQIFEKTLKAMNLVPPEHESPRSEEQEEDEAFVISVLNDRLQGDPAIDIRTCEDFKHLTEEQGFECNLIINNAIDRAWAGPGRKWLGYDKYVHPRVSGCL